MRLAAGFPVYVAIYFLYITGRAAKLLQCTSGGVAGLCGICWGSSGRLESDGLLATFPAGHLRYGSSVTIRPTIDNSASQPSGVGVPGSKAQPVHSGWWRPYEVDRPKPLGDSRSAQFFYGNFNSGFIISGEENEIRECPRPVGRERVSGHRRQSPCKTDGMFHLIDRWATGSGRGADKRTIVSATSEGLRAEPTAIRGFRCVHSTQQAIHEGNEIQDILAYDGRRIYGPRSSWTLDLLPMASVIQGLEDIDAYAGDLGSGPHPEVRAADGEHDEAAAGLLAFDSISRRPGKIRPAGQDTDADRDQPEPWRSGTSRLGGQQTELGTYLQVADRGSSLLARTCTCTSNGVVGLWQAWSTEDTGRSHGGSCNARRRKCFEGRSGTGAQLEVDRRSGFTFKKATSESGQEGGKEEEIEKRKRRVAKIQKRWRRKIQRKRKGKDRKRRAAVLQLEQQQWGMRWFASWCRMPRWHQEDSQMHEVHVPWAPVFAMPYKGKVKEHGDATAGDREGDHDDGGRDHGAGARKSSGDGEERDCREHGDGGDGENKRKRIGEEDEEEFKLTEEGYLRDRKFLFIHHFAGKRDVLGEAIKTAAQLHGLKVEVISVDRESGTGNLMEAEPFDTHLGWARDGKVDGYHTGWPCSTFSRLRWRECVGLPGPVRSRKFPYGFPSNGPREQEECDAGTVMLARSLMMAEAIEARKNGSTLGGFATLENPPPSSLPEHQSAWEMEETKAYMEKWRPLTANFNTCCYEPDVETGKKHFKPQRFVGSLYDLGSLSGRCDCGEAGHESIVGPKKSKASAEYPEALCAKYAELAMQHFTKLARIEFYRKKVAHAELKLSRMKKKARSMGAEPVQSRIPWSPVLGPSSSTSASTVTSASGWHGFQEIHDWRGGMGKHEALRSSQSRQADPKQQCFLGGMRHPARVVRSMGNAQSLGIKIRAAWNHFVAKFPETLDVAEKYGTPDCQLDKELVEGWNGVLKDIVNAPEEKEVILTENKIYRSTLDAELLEGWIKASADPDIVLPQWVREGVPLGIEKRIPCMGVFPPSDEAGPALASEDAVSAIIRGDLLNYTSVEDNKTLAHEELTRYKENKYLHTLSASEAEEMFPRRTVSKLGLILKQKEDGSVKKRIIVDMRRSHGNQKAHLPERLVLPRPLDVITMTRDIHEPAAHSRMPKESYWGCEYVLIDVTDAFMSFAVHREEWGHCLAPFPKMVGEDPEMVCFTALLFGFKTAPLLYSRLASLVSRLLQAITKAEIGIHQTYLDDSLWYFQGPLEERNKAISLILHTMAALGLKVAFSKGHRSSMVQWIGVTFKLVNGEKVVMGLPEPFLKATIDMLKDWSTRGYVPVKELRSLAGRMSWVAGVLPRSRWTVAVLYAVLKDEDRPGRDKGGKTGLFPVKRMEQTRVWLQTFLETAASVPMRTFQLKPNKTAEVSLTTDASPEALGGYLVINGALVAAFASRVTTEDAEILGFEKGSSSSQGIVEALAIVVALRLWRKKIPQGLLELRIQSDSIVALAMSEKLAASSPGLNFLGAELGVVMEELLVEQFKTCHVPGPANTVADYLSRPSKWLAHSRPALLGDVSVTFPEGRKEDFYALPSPRRCPNLWGQSEDLPLHKAWDALR